MSEPTVIPGHSGKDVAIALVGMDGDDYRYIDLSNNTIFTSENENRRVAYVENREKMAIARVDKQMELIGERKKALKVMIRVMMNVILCMIKRKFDDCEIVSEDMISDFFEYGDVYDKVVSIYFKAGALLNIQVNNAKKVFTKCVVDRKVLITQTALGNLQHDVNDAEMYNIIDKYMKSCKNNKRF